MIETTIGLLRHGQTDWNIDFRLQGVTDIPLNETGIAQSKDAAAAIDPQGWDLVITSPLSRARDTAQFVTSISGIPGAEVEPLLIERSFGEAEGMTHEEWLTLYAESKVVPGGESLEELETRAQRLLDTLALNYSGKRVIAVSHGALIRILLKIVSEGEFPREGERLGNACMSIFIHQDGKWRVESYEPRTLHIDLNG